jgi:hypothetical protein
MIMKRTQYSPWIVAVLATFAGTSGADMRQGGGAQAPTRLEAPVEPDSVPAVCHRFLEIPADSRSEMLPWQQRLSLAACRQAVPLTTVQNPLNEEADMNDLRSALASLDREMAPSIAIYRDAMARAPGYLRIMGAYGLGMAYINTMVRARSLVRGGSYGGATYGAQVDGPQALRAALEPLLVAKRDAALAAFDEVARLAETDPAAARANQVVVYAVQDARRTVSRLR